MPASVLGGRETDVKDLEGVNRFRGESQAMATSYNMHQGKGGYGDTKKVHLDSYRPGKFPRRATPGLSCRTEGRAPEGRCKA